MVESIKLEEEEIKKFLSYKNNVELERFNLGNNRKQYLLSEKKILELLENYEKEMYNFVRELADNKNIPKDETWVFDPGTFCFNKK